MCHAKTMKKSQNSRACADVKTNSYRIYKARAPKDLAAALSQLAPMVASPHFLELVRQQQRRSPP